jgi:hypothetical protein
MCSLPNLISLRAPINREVSRIDTGSGPSSEDGGRVNSALQNESSNFDECALFVRWTIVDLFVTLYAHVIPCRCETC